VKFRWLAAMAAYGAASVAVLFVPWSEMNESAGDARCDWDLVRFFASGGALIELIRLLWMVPILAASAVVWLSARRGIRPAHAEISLALALGAAAYPFASFPEPGCPSTWVGSSAAAFVVTFAGVLGWRAFSRQRANLILSPRGTTPML